jgi:hypothetical protein
MTPRHELSKRDRVFFPGFWDAESATPSVALFVPWREYRSFLDIPNSVACTPASFRTRVEPTQHLNFAYRDAIPGRCSTHQQRDGLQRSRLDAPTVVRTPRGALWRYSGVRDAVVRRNGAVLMVARRGKTAVSPLVRMRCGGPTTAG